MKTNPLISVVVPAYNAAPFLQMSLDSLLSQDVKEIEIICVNDGSTDNTLDILKEYAAKDSRICILDGPNGGYGKAMNRGLKAANGKYFAILEPDDYLAPDSYGWMVELLEKYQLDFLKGGTGRFYTNEKGKDVFTRHHSYPIGDEVVCPRKHPELFLGISPDTWNGMYRMDFLRKFNIEYHETPGASYQDAGFFHQTFTLAEKAMFCNREVYMYRTDNPFSSTSARCSKPYALREEYRYIREKLEKYPDNWNEVKGIYLAHRVAGHRWIYSSLPESIKIEYLHETRKEFVELEKFSREHIWGDNKNHFEEILISPEYHLMCELFRRSKEDNHTESRCCGGSISKLELLCCESSFRRRYVRCSVLKFFVFGKKRNHYKQEIKLYRTLLKKIDCLKKELISDSF